MHDVTPLRILKILKYPNTLLATVTEPVTEFNDRLLDQIRDMFVTMYTENGIGLAANQVGIMRRFFVMDTSNSGDKRQVYINPTIIEHNDPEPYKEGCLSFPGVTADTSRSTKIKIRAQDETGNVFERDLEGLDAICFSHELDHLWGITFVDSLSPLKKQMIVRKVSKRK